MSVCVSAGHFAS